MEGIDLSSFFHTRDQANDFSIRLSTISEKIYQNNFDLDKTLSEQFGLKKKDALIAFLRTNKVNAQSPSELNSFFNTLIDKISELPVLSISIAFNPTEETLRMLSEWFLLNRKSQVLFEIIVNPDLIAGCTISFNGKYIDYSIKPMFKQIVKDVMVNKNNPKTDIPSAPLVEHQSTEHITVGR
jgi:F0F1-type ATP synthase delta subunit